MGEPPAPANLMTAPSTTSSAGDRRVILRELPADCLLHGELHPSIKERLARIREIPHPGVAPLLGLERDNSGRVWLAWSFVDGEGFVDAASDPDRSIREAATLMREL